MSVGCLYELLNMPSRKKKIYSFYILLMRSKFIYKKRSYIQFLYMYYTYTFIHNMNRHTTRLPKLGLTEWARLFFMILCVRLFSSLYVLFILNHLQISTKQIWFDWCNNYHILLKDYNFVFLSFYLFQRFLYPRWAKWCGYPT